MLEILLPYFPSFARSLGFLLFLPLSTFGLGIFSKISFAMLLSALVGPFQDWSIGLIVENLIIGFLIASPVLLVLEFGKAFLDVLSTVSGINFSVLYSFLESNDRNLLSSFFSLVCFVNFIQNGLLTCLDFLISHNLTFNLWTMFDLATLIFKHFTLFFAPILVIFTIVEVALGFFQKVLPTFTVTFEVQAIKILILLFITVSTISVSFGDFRIGLNNLLYDLQLIRQT